MRKLAAAVIAALSVLTAGCFNIEQTLTLEKDMSGSAGFAMSVDMEPLAGFMAMLKHSMSGKQGAPSAAEIAEVRKEMLSSTKKSAPTDLEKEKKELQAALPAGVRLLDAGFKEEGLKISANFRLGFDQASKLAQIKLQPKGGPAAAPPIDNPMESPFGGLQVQDEGRTILITSPARNPVADQTQPGQMPPMDPAMKSQMDAMLKGIRVAFKITAPFEVVEHNAHRKEGTTLIWDYNIEALEKMSTDQAMQGIKVRYRK